VTGAVDIATARSLGVYDDPESDEAVAPSTTASPSPAIAATTVAAPAQAAGVDDPAEPSTAGGGVPRWPLVAGLTVVACTAAVAGRRRYVVGQRAARRWARVHPATSPRRSVADMRRPGEAAKVELYDRELEESPRAP
jgi:hypothetical protein